MSEVPPEIVALRRRLAELEQIADAHSAFNAALRRRAAKSPPEQPEVEQPNLAFNSTLRRLARRTEVSGEDFNSAIRTPRNRITIEPEETP